MSGRPGRLVAVLAAAAVLAGGAACSSGHRNAEKDAAKAVVAKAPATVCSAQAAARQVRPPDGFPADFPMPPGTVLVSAEDRGDAGLVVTGVTNGRFASVLAALHRDLPVHGYTAKDGETEPHDAESDWVTASYTGRWAIRELPQCPGDTSVSVVARKR